MRKGAAAGGAGTAPSASASSKVRFIVFTGVHGARTFTSKVTCVAARRTATGLVETHRGGAVGRRIPSRLHSSTHAITFSSTVQRNLKHVKGNSATMRNTLGQHHRLKCVMTLGHCRNFVSRTATKNVSSDRHRGVRSMVRRHPVSLAPTLVEHAMRNKSPSQDTARYVHPPPKQLERRARASGEHPR
jgi:hypothetical protein